MRGLKFIDGDFVRNPATGGFATVTGKDKLRADVDYAIDQAGIDDLIGRLGPFVALQAEISRRIRASLSALQSAQSRVSPNRRTPEERLSRVAKVEVTPFVKPSGKPSQRAVAWKVSVQSQAFAVVSTAGTQDL